MMNCNIDPTLLEFSSISQSDEQPSLDLPHVDHPSLDLPLAPPSCPQPQEEALPGEELDTSLLAQRVTHYLRSNQILSTRFASLVLGISQGRLSILLGKPRPWGQLAPRVRALYQRMQLWMDTRATYGNNPYMKLKKEKKVPFGKTRGEGRSTGKKPRKMRSLFEARENMEVLVKQEDVAAMQGMVSEAEVPHEVAAQVVEEEQVWEVPGEQMWEELGEQVVFVMVVQEDPMEPIVTTLASRDYSSLTTTPSLPALASGSLPPALTSSQKGLEGDHPPSSIENLLESSASDASTVEFSPSNIENLLESSASDASTVEFSPSNIENLLEEMEQMQDL